MKSKLIAAAIVAGLSSPAAASTLLDFTSSDIGTSNLSGSVVGVGYSISGFGGSLTDATHSNNVGCDLGAGYACDAVGADRFDVGFGVTGGGNSNEVDGIDSSEYVEVAFDEVVIINGFAGMLTYDDSQDTDGTEQTQLMYSNDGGATFMSLMGTTLFDDNDPNPFGNDTFGTVGLSFLSGLEIQADVVRFSASGTNPFDDGNANITAAALEVSAIPVPAAFPLLLAGIGAFGWASRRQKRASS